MKYLPLYIKQWDWEDRIDTDHPFDSNWLENQL